ncbi:Kef-type K+ transport system, membrane components [Serpentinimonas raichei]|uniref:Kef-type K+ transport system, membrane components n=1 Tax=Serpentinimonas raichei TaxID=1458425 RepID=A0A060NH07_9BURK|nr:monovalent cation:proton antiporter family protein [Serpentinimonas raichei]BAO81136.1 Kef-type K+ transport system, membrane components [Serpentinimonas raichei]
MTPLLELLALLAAAVAAVALFQRSGIPASLGYLAVGALLGPYVAGLISHTETIRLVAEFGIVFLLFTIGLNFSLPQIYALRHTVFWLGTGQVVLTTALVTLAGWALGFPLAAAFVVGAVFAQSSTTIIARQLSEQGEEHSRHGRLGLAMSVFQDVTAVPFLIIIPALGLAAAGSLAEPLGWALVKALLAFALVYLAGRWLLRPLFHAIAVRRSTELFTLTVLLVTLASAAITDSLGLSLAFGAFLAGMMLGETEFRHQIESTIRPFRDVLLGLFFVSIGMLVNPLALLAVWHWALLGALALLVAKVLLVALLVRAAGFEPRTALRTALVLAMGGEFGFALLALGLAGGSIDGHTAQIALAAVLLSMMIGPFLVRYSLPLSAALLGRERSGALNVTGSAPHPEPTASNHWKQHVILCGYGRIGQSVANFLERERIAHVALDLDPTLVRDAHAAGEPVFYGDATDPAVLEAVGLARARLLIISYEDPAAALKVLQQVRALHPDLPVMVRTRDETHVEALRQAGATEVVPETLEAAMMMVAHALALLQVPTACVLRRLREARSDRYRLLRELFQGDPALDTADAATPRLHSVTVPAGCAALGCRLGQLELSEGVELSALLRHGQRMLDPAPDLLLQADDVLVLFGKPDALAQAEQRLLS